MSENETNYTTAPKRTIESVGPNEVIHCTTEAEAIAICNLMHDAGLKWSDGSSYKTESEWDGYMGLVYYPTEGVMGCLDFVSTAYTILPASDFLPTTRTEAPAYDVSVIAGPPQAAPAGKEGYTITPLQYLKMVADFAAVYIATNPTWGVVDTSETAVKMVKAMLKETGLTVSHSAPTVAHDMD